MKSKFKKRHKRLDVKIETDRWELAGRVTDKVSAPKQHEYIVGYTLEQLQSSCYIDNGRQVYWVAVANTEVTDTDDGNLEQEKKKKEVKFWS